MVADRLVPALPDPARAAAKSGPAACEQGSSRCYSAAAGRAMQQP